MSCNIKKREPTYDVELQQYSVTLTEAEMLELQRNINVALLKTPDWRVLALAGQKIDAIKRMKEIGNYSLRVSKSIVDKYVELTELQTAVMIHFFRTNDPLPPNQEQDGDKEEHKKFELLECGCTVDWGCTCACE